MGELEQAARAGDRSKTMSVIRTLVPDHTAEAAIAHTAPQTRQELGST
jgi:hypothetical protein